MGSSFRLLKILRVLFSERIDELIASAKTRSPESVRLVYSNHSHETLAW